MVKRKKRYIIAGGLLFFVIYIFGAAQPIPTETVLTLRWIHSLTSTYPTATFLETSPLLPFQLGDHFGFVDKNGNFSINQVKKNYISLSDDGWAEYATVPASIEVRDPMDNIRSSIDTALGYPLFLDKRTFLVSSEQNAISALDDNGNVSWSYDFAATLTCVDAAAGFLLAGSLDGTIEILDDQGKRVFFFEPGGSRLSIILGCAFSKDSSRFAIISGIDEQRFLLMERLGDSLNNEYRVVYNEFLGEGFRRPIHIVFVDNNRRVAFERESGLGLYEIASRTSLNLPLQGEISAIDESGNNHLLFLITSQSDVQKRLVSIQFPGTIMAEAPFKSENIFLGRQDNVLYLGGGTTLISFEVDKK
jgi:hypothetical protein